MEEAGGTPSYEAHRRKIDMSASNLQGSSWDALLRKYAYVWIWSVLVGSVTSVGFSFFGFSGGRWGAMGTGLIAFTFFGAASVLVSLAALSKFFSGYLLPIFFGDTEVTTEESLRAALLLRRSFRYLVFAVLIKFAMSAVEQLLSATYSRF
jgi:hypothetical protein